MAAISAKEREIKALITRLDETIYKFARFAEGMAEERKEITQQATALKALTEKITEQQEHLLSSEKQIKKSVNDLFFELSKRIAESTSEVVSSSVREKVNLEISDTVISLKQILNKVSSVLNTLIRRDKWKTGLFHAGVFIGVILVGLFVNKIIFPSELNSFSDHQLQVYTAGLTLESFWPKLSAQNQNALLQMANGSGRYLQK